MCLKRALSRAYLTALSLYFLPHIFSFYHCSIYSQSSFASSSLLRNISCLFFSVFLSSKKLRHQHILFHSIYHLHHYIFINTISTTTNAAAPPPPPSPRNQYDQPPFSLSSHQLKTRFFSCLSIYIYVLPRARSTPTRVGNVRGARLHTLASVCAAFTQI